MILTLESGRGGTQDDFSASTSCFNHTLNAQEHDLNGPLETRSQILVNYLEFRSQNREPVLASPSQGWYLALSLPPSG